MKHTAVGLPCPTALRSQLRCAPHNDAERAFYYVRVIEIPTPRWTAYEALRFGVEMSEEVPMITQERAYTSAIWYTPKS